MTNEGLPMTLSTIQALEKLRHGHRHFLSQAPSPVSDHALIRRLHDDGQHPFATVVTCSDSRVSPEILFSCRLGDIFTIRTAGHVLTDIEFASIEYALDHLHTPLVLILAHTHCGAVKSACMTPEVSASSRLQALLDEITPSVYAAKAHPVHDIPLTQQVEDIHLERTLERLVRLPHFKDRANLMMAAKYDIESSQILYLKSASFEDDGQLTIQTHPWQ